MHVKRKSGEKTKYGLITSLEFLIYHKTVSTTNEVHSLFVTLFSRHHLSLNSLNYNMASQKPQKSPQGSVKNLIVGVVAGRPKMHEKSHVWQQTGGRLCR